MNTKRHQATGEEDPVRYSARKHDKSAAPSEPMSTRTTLPKFMKDKGIEFYPYMPVQFGRLKAKVFGGKFVEWAPGQRRVVSVKMAAEVDHPHDISIPTEDYKTPSYRAMHDGIAKALEAIYNGNDLYVGCYGGIGRTGLFMACLAKVMFDYEDSHLPGNSPSVPVADPVWYVRNHYFSKAVETTEQRQFVVDFDTREHVNYLIGVLDPKTRVEVRVVEKEVPVYHFNPFLAFAQLFAKK